MSKIKQAAAMAQQFPALLSGALPNLAQLNQVTLAQSWAALQGRPYGKQLFSQLIKLKIPYSGSLGAQVEEVADGHAVVTLRDRRAVRNHLDSIHAIALANLGEFTTGLAVFHRLDGRAKGIVTDLRIQYLKKARGTLTAHCDIAIPEITAKMHMEVPGVIKNASGEVVAKVWATWQLQPL